MFIQHAPYIQMSKVKPPSLSRSYNRIIFHLIQYVGYRRMDSHLRSGHMSNLENILYTNLQKYCNRLYG